VASKRVGRAVRRNRAKRLLRALFIEYGEELPKGHYILVAKPTLLESDFTRIRKSFHSLMRRVRE